MINKVGTPIPRTIPKIKLFSFLLSIMPTISFVIENSVKWVVSIPPISWFQETLALDQFYYNSSKYNAFSCDFLYISGTLQIIKKLIP